MDGHLIRFDKKVKYSFIDLETFNLCLTTEYNEPWQTAIINVTGEEITSRHDLISKWTPKPYLFIKPEIARMNHHSDDRIERDGIYPEDALDIIEESLRACDYIVGHNILGFDVYLIRDYFRHYGREWKWIMPKIIDTRAVAQGIKTNYKYDSKENFLNYQYKLINTRVRGVKTQLKILAKENDIEFDENKLHDALYDLEINLKVWNKLKYQIEL